MSGERIPIDCEGAGCPPAAWADVVTRSDGEPNGTGVCQMCGRLVDIRDGRALPHKRDDILARLARGDFE